MGTGELAEAPFGVGVVVGMEVGVGVNVGATAPTGAGVGLGVGVGIGVWHTGRPRHRCQRCTLWFEAWRYPP